MPSIRVDSLLESREAGLALELVAGRQGLTRRITGPRIQKPGLALTGYTAYVHPERLQVLGMTEISFLSSLTPEQRKFGLEKLCSLEVSAIAITRGLAVPEELLVLGEQTSTPIFTTTLMSSVFINRVTKWLEERLSPTTSVHGVLIDVL